MFIRIYSIKSFISIFQKQFYWKVCIFFFGLKWTLVLLTVDWPCYVTFSTRWWWLIFQFVIEVHIIFCRLNFIVPFLYFRYSNNILCLLLLYFSPRGQWMDYKCWVGSLGNASTASGVATPGRRPSGLNFSFEPASLISILLSLTFSCFFILCYSCCNVIHAVENTRAWVPDYL